MRRSVFVLVCMLFAASGCSALDFFRWLNPADNIRVTAGSIDGVIFTARNAAEVGLQYEFNETILDYWTPTEEQVVALEGGLVHYLEAQIAPDDYRYGFWEDLEFYRRQYFGITFEGGEPLIYANYFCVEDFDYWLESFVMVMDGGDCFFQVLYDPAANTFSGLRVNGVA